MDNIIMKIDSVVESFVNRISPKPKYYIKELDVLSDVKNNQNWVEWSNDIGIYIFITNNQKVHYIGRALRNSLFGARISSHVNFDYYTQMTDWGVIIRNPNTRIRLYKFENIHDDYWVAGLELFLIDEFAPDCNGKRG